MKPSPTFWVSHFETNRWVSFALAPSGKPSVSCRFPSTGDQKAHLNWLCGVRCVFPSSQQKWYNNKAHTRDFCWVPVLRLLRFVSKTPYPRVPPFFDNSRRLLAPEERFQVRRSRVAGPKRRKPRGQRATNSPRGQSPTESQRSNTCALRFTSEKTYIYLYFAFNVHVWESAVGQNLRLGRA